MRMSDPSGFRTCTTQPNMKMSDPSVTYPCMVMVTYPYYVVMVTYP
jgi:hypothetical protein